ncbi:1-acyl-sn-glycerol-3-phosphate acyltransferase [Methylophilaceae bacterium]|jgi:1-acyl-sn-glycerol-3-phosphate acyltransferase|nr:1-acyl-sn-glycerol-3-phosphate acyltransferase [Methylophilaceae bacterium]|tara:strand:- start:1376 stop:2092 length:717 start_codon:yes stop_codon:yes gene_type:complete
MIKFILIIAHLVIGTFSALYILNINNKQKNFFIKWWSLRLLKIFNVNLIVNKNLKKILRKKNYLIVSNHISWLDIFVINSICPVTFVSKYSVSKWPFIGWLAKATDTIFIDRSRISKIKETTIKIEHHLENKGSIFMFPEGTSTNGLSVLPFKSNLFQSAINTNSDILPIGIQYQHKNKFTSAPSYIGDMSLVDSVLNLIKLEKIDAKITILSPISKNRSRKLLAKKAYQIINNLIKS